MGASRINNKTHLKQLEHTQQAGANDNRQLLTYTRKSVNEDTPGSTAEQNVTKGSFAIYQHFPKYTNCMQIFCEKLIFNDNFYSHK